VPAGIERNRRFGFQKSRQLSIGTHYETLSVAAVPVNNQDCLSANKEMLTENKDPDSIAS
jgi:hypothetical protein